MVDQNKFINTYIDIIINSLTEHIKSNLQLQTQIKVNEFVVAEKDQVIASLNQQLNENKIAEDWKVKYDAAEVNYSAILNKLKHMDTLLAQINEMKKTIVAKDLQISNLTSQIEDGKSSKKVINNKAKNKEEVLIVAEESKQVKTLDDF